MKKRFKVLLLLTVGLLISGCVGSSGVSEEPITDLTGDHERIGTNNIKAIKNRFLKSAAIFA